MSSADRHTARVRGRRQAWALVLVGTGYVFSEISDKALGEVAGQAALVMLLAFLALAWFLSKRLDEALPDKG